MLIFAHRGASGYAPENTIKAMQLALTLGAEAIELDVHLVEGELMVFHDRWLDPKSSGQGLIANTRLDELANITLDGEAIPSLWTLMAAMMPRPLVNIELKGANTPAGLIKIYPKLIDQLGYRPDQLLISSFNHRYLQLIKQALPNAFVAPLLEGEPLELAAAGTALGAYSVHLNVNFITIEMVQDAHQRGLKVYVYAVDRKEDIQWMLDLGVDGIFSNFPDKARDYIEQISTPISSE
ncbi:MAG: glycerophosphodiester phosphodiesterase [Shewanella sp.]|nr:glycerophosphodiester phosphodiesterase [Shewanella sp.]MCF1429424.1 glycerophosphodiester phosphodiesterase [Shewanella sp.]MCF1438125.1 glycerophosphodiester phosphodiesterase [Shewanella sp.]MCF1456004.1 glycerophosphodiester phosphodiesterase [Shewanella sp.]